MQELQDFLKRFGAFIAIGLVFLFMRGRKAAETRRKRQRAAQKARKAKVAKAKRTKSRPAARKKTTSTGGKGPLRGKAKQDFIDRMQKGKRKAARLRKQGK